MTGGVSYEEAHPKHEWSIPKGAKTVRFTDENWLNFFKKGKKTTWRTKRYKDGIYERVKGSWFNPKLTGERLELRYAKEKLFSELNTEDAIGDGFDNLEQFKQELMSLNKKKILDKPIILFCHDAKVLQGQSRLETEFEDRR